MTARINTIDAVHPALTAERDRFLTVKIGVSGRQVAAVLLAALFGAAAFPPLGLWPLALVSVCCFLYQVRDRTSAQARQLGLLYGLVYGLGTMYWIFGIFGPVAISFVALMAVYFGILATLIGMTRDLSSWVRCALAGIFAVAIEWLRGDAWYLRFPWYTVPHGLAQSPAWIALAHWLGVYGLSYVIWFIVAAGALDGRHWWLAFLLLPAVAWLLPLVTPPDRTAILIQAEDSTRHESLIAKLPAEQVNLAVLPEYAFPFSCEQALTSSHGPAVLARKLNCPVIFGSVHGTYGDAGFQNIAAVLDANGRLQGTFPKQRPVPLMLDGEPGDRRPVFAADGGVLGIGLCYDFDAPEIAGSLVRQGATVLIAPTGDLMDWGRIQHLHHELIVRLRAVENDRWVLRATSSGRSEAIDPHGVPSMDHLGIGTTGTIKVGYAHRVAFALGSYSYFLGPLAACLTILFVVQKFMWRRRRICNAIRSAPTQSKESQSDQDDAENGYRLSAVGAS
jgi:apolipoprotein N-acyltransferase